LFREKCMLQLYADGFPVSDGHTLIVPRRHVRSVFELVGEEQLDVWDLVAEVRDQLRLSLTQAPDAFNRSGAYYMSYRKPWFLLMEWLLFCLAKGRKSQANLHAILAQFSIPFHNSFIWSGSSTWFSICLGSASPYGQPEAVYFCIDLVLA
jgi:hypothetical protein